MDKKQFLSASNGNGEPMLATITEDRPNGAMLIKVDGVTNFPTRFIATTGQVDGSGFLVADTMSVFYAHTDLASPNNIYIDRFATGYSDKGNTAGERVMVKPTSEWANEVAEAIEDIGYMKNTNSDKMMVISTAKTQPQPDPNYDILWLRPIDKE